MRKFLLFLSLILTLSAASQVSPGNSYRVTNSSTSFNTTIPAGDLITDMNTNTIYLCIIGALSTETLSSASSKFIAIYPGFTGTSGYISKFNGTHSLGSSSIFENGGNYIGLGGVNNPIAQLAFPTATSAAGGIVFGTDTYIYRSGSGYLNTNATFIIGGDLYNSGNVWCNQDFIFYGNAAIGLRFLNKNGDNYLYASVRDVSGSEAVWNLSNLGSITTTKIKTTVEGGYTVQFTAGESLSQGDVVMMGSSNDYVVKAYSASDPLLVGVSYSSATVGQGVWVVIKGKALTNFSSSSIPTLGHLALPAASSQNGKVGDVTPMSVYYINSILGEILETKTAGVSAYVNVNIHYPLQAP